MAVNAMPEKRVVDIWQNRVSGRSDLVTEEGNPLKVIYPGRPNDDRGADLLDAVIASGRELVKGDIEVHVRSSYWRAHRHHLDPHYNRVVLHVVFYNDVSAPATLQNGNTVPTLALNRLTESTPLPDAGNVSASTARLPCRHRILRIPDNTTGRLLDAAGDERFRAKMAGFRAALTQIEAQQCLYQGIMEALGYARNKRPFLELSRRMPLESLESVGAGSSSDTEHLARIQARLIGAAGLLPSQRIDRNRPDNSYDGWAEKLEALWADSRHGRNMSENDWHLFKIRPGNFPMRRLAAMSHLLLRFGNKGILASLAEILRETPDIETPGRLGKALRVEADDYWAGHRELGRPGRTRMPALLGNSRAADIAVNILLPFFAARADLVSRPTLAKKIRNLYLRYPRLGTNTVERHMIGQLGVNRRLIDSARRQQGLLQIYKTRCTRGKCQDCPLSNETKISDSTPLQLVNRPIY